MDEFTIAQKKYIVEKYFMGQGLGEVLPGAEAIGYKLLEKGTCVIAGYKNHWQHLGVTDEVAEEFIGCIRLKLDIMDLFRCATYRSLHKKYLRQYKEEVDKANKVYNDTLDEYASIVNLTVDPIDVKFND